MVKEAKVQKYTPEQLKERKTFQKKLLFWFAICGGILICLVFLVNFLLLMFLKPTTINSVEEKNITSTTVTITLNVEINSGGGQIGYYVAQAEQNSQNGCGWAPKEGLAPSNDTNYIIIGKDNQFSPHDEDDLPDVPDLNEEPDKIEFTIPNLSPNTNYLLYFLVDGKEDKVTGTSGGCPLSFTTNY